MSDFLSEFLANDGVVEKTINFRGKEGTVHFRRISGTERSQLLKGQRIQSAGEDTTMEIDLGDNQHAKLMLVAFSFCKPDGARIYKNANEAGRLEADKIDALYALAREVNKQQEEADLGKA